MEGKEERVIRVMPIVTTVSFVRVHVRQGNLNPSRLVFDCTVKDKTRGVQVTLTWYNYREYVNCEKPSESPNSPHERPHHDARLLVGASKTTGGESW